MEAHGSAAGAPHFSLPVTLVENGNFLIEHEVGPSQNTRRMSSRGAGSLLSVALTVQLLLRISGAARSGVCHGGWFKQSCSLIGSYVNLPLNELRENEGDDRAEVITSRSFYYHPCSRGCVCSGTEMTPCVHLSTALPRWRGAGGGRVYTVRWADTTDWLPLRSRWLNIYQHTL